MPLYEYRCTHCDYLFEMLHSFMDDQPCCPVCGASTEKIISSTSVHFKGTGFHCTDYTKHGSKKKITRVSRL